MCPVTSIPTPPHRKAVLALLVLSAALFVAPRACADFRAQFGVRIPMRDGVHLSADVWLPKEPGRYPALLVRTPYVKSVSEVGLSDSARFFANHGYVVVLQDTRGRGDSDGQFAYFSNEARDGYDSIEWIAAQPWSNGKVGMYGVSYLGSAQWLAAREHPPHLICIAPTAAAGRYFDELPYRGGAFMFEWAIQWGNYVSERSLQRSNTAGLNMKEILDHRPLLTVDEAFGRPMPIYRELLEHNTLDEYSQRIQLNASDFRSLDLPALTITGWFDPDQSGALFYWRNMRSASPGKDKQYLLAGPWTHIQTFYGGTTKLGDFEFSGDSIYDTRALQLAFFDHFLKGSTPSFNFPRARIYITGANQWRDYDEYTPSEARSRPLYFHSGGRANTLGGDGQLTWDSPADEPADHYTYDPHHPVRPADGETADQRPDQRYLERRDDVLVYSTAVLEHPVTIAGKIFVHLFAATDARDTDFTARLLDVDESGRALQLGPFIGIIRARYRHGYERTEFLAPGKTEHYQIELYDIAHTFLPGHRLRVEISSSYAPTFNPNQNTGNPVATDTEWRLAQQTILHNVSSASYIDLPVVPNP